MRNWKTTAAGIALIAFAVYEIAAYVAGSETDFEAVSRAVLAALAGLGLSFARDSKPTDPPA